MPHAAKVTWPFPTFPDYFQWFPMIFSNFQWFLLLSSLDYIFTSLISASPITQGHFLYRSHQHLSTPVWLTMGLSVYLAAFIYKRGDSFLTTSLCLLGNNHTDCFWLTTVLCSHCTSCPRPEWISSIYTPTMHGHCARLLEWCSNFYLHHHARSARWHSKLCSCTWWQIRRCWRWWWRRPSSDF